MMRFDTTRLFALGGGFLRSIGIYALTNAFSRVCAFGALPFLAGYAAVASASGSAFVAVALAAFASRRGWPGADTRWAHWSVRALLLALLIDAGSALNVFDTVAATLGWGGTVLAIWLMSMGGQIAVPRSALRESVS